MISDEQLHTALINADAAGDTDAARQLAAEVARRRQAAPAAVAAPQQASMLDRAQAAASGVNTGALTQLPGLPVATALNVADLVRAGYGAVGKATGMLSPEQMPQLLDRSKYVMSPEWIQAQIRNAGGGGAIDPNVPTDTASRILHAGGTAVGAFPVPGQLGRTAISGLAAQGVAEAGGGPAMSALVGMAPFAGGVMPSRGPQQPILTPEQIALRQRAQELGYELTPGQESGKRWQQNIEAAMREAPSTSGRMQAINARNMDLTNRLVADAQNLGGGPIDQGTAGAAALKGMRSGIDQQAELTGQAYRDLLANVPVNLERQRGPLEQIRKGQLQLPADQQGGAAMGALENLLGTPGYAPVQRKFSMDPLNPAKDDVITAIRKMGGMNPGDEAVGSLAKANPFPNDPRFGPVWRKPQVGMSASNKTVAGHSLDDMAAKLYQAGYIAERDPNLVMDKIADSTISGPQYSAFRDQGAAHADPLATAIEALTSELGEKNAPAQLPGYLRQNPTVPGNIAQDLRSGYGAASNSAFEGGKVQQGEVYAKMKAAVDNAIDSSLPKSAKGQFEALNHKYGMDMAISAMKPESQETFLAQLYRGAPDQFYTFLGVTSPQSFKVTAQGFISKLIEGATNTETKNVSASALGKAIDKLNPGDTGRADVMKYFGGHAAPLLTDVGAIGKNILPDPVGNPGTAQRLWYQSLLRGGGLAGGAGVGAALGGAPGAMLGSLMGDFVVPKAVQTAYLSKAARPYLVGKPQQAQRLTQQEEWLRKYGGLLGLSSVLQGNGGLLGGGQ